MIGSGEVIWNLGGLVEGAHFVVAVEAVAIIEEAVARLGEYWYGWYRRRVIAEAGGVWPACLSRWST